MTLRNRLFLILLITPMSLMAADLYVSPSGSDANRGNETAPVATLARAQELVRPHAGKLPITVHVADGVYYLPETLVFTPADSGSASNPIVYKAQNEGGAILSGGSELDLTWKPYRDGIFQATTPAGLEIDQLFINGRNQRMARYPNYDANKKAEAYQGFAADAFSKERAARWADPKGGYIHAMHRSRWGGYHYLITGKDAKGEVTYEGGWQNNRQMGMHKDFRMVENIFEELDAEGEWYHNSNTNTLYYKPAAGTDLNAAKAEVVRLRHLLEFQGSEADPVKHITLQGFVVRHAARTFMDTKEQLLRSDWAIYRGGAFMLTGTEDVSILDSEFDQVGGNAIFVNNYNRRTLVKGCHIHDAGASGVCFVGDPAAVRDPLFEYGEKNDLAKIDRTPGPKTNNYPLHGVVEDCLIHGIGRTERQPAGVQIEMAMEITVRDTSIYDTARAGINIGDGAWGGHLIERVDVFDTVLETHDHGSFNSWGRDRFWRSDQPTTQAAVDKEPALPFLDAIKTTTIRDSRWRCDHGWDVDLDDGSTNYDLYNNLMLTNGLKLREGFRRHAWNNVAPFGSLHPHVWYDRSKDQVYGNIFGQGHRPARMSRPYVDGTMVDRNFFINDVEKILKGAAKLGWDASSIGGDPMFIDPENGDFRVKEGSPVLKLGFKNFPMDQFGVKKPSLKAIARTPEIPVYGAKQSKGHNTKAVKKAVVVQDAKWLGATLHSLSGDEFSAFGVTQEAGGVAVLALPKSSLAAKAGIEEGDLIQGVNGKPVSNLSQFFNALSKAKSPDVKLKLVRDQQLIELSLTLPYTVQIETAANMNSFTSLHLPTSPSGTITASPKTNNEPLGALVDGKLGKGFGPVFANGVSNGAYKMDLGSVKAVSAINSWSVAMGQRGTQKVTLYGSDASKDPGWDLNKWSVIGSIDTSGSAGKVYTAASLRAASGKALGDFRWVLWSVSPVTTAGGGENTSFQELGVELVGNQPNSVPQSANAFPGEKSNFKGYDRYNIKTEKGSFSVICPKQAAPGKPWLWRSLFWEQLTKVNQADLKLVDQGYHVVIAFGDVHGHPKGNANIDAAYEFFTTKYGFSKKCSMASFSRGTLSLFTWASVNPKKVSSIYVDNGVCNVDSWPAGNLVAGSGSKGSGNAGSWEGMKAVYGFTTDQQLLDAEVSPIEKLEPLAQAGVPILMVCGNKDTAVPYEENDAIMEARYKKLGGSIEVIVEDKGHTHGMNDPSPVIAFIKKHTN